VPFAIAALVGDTAIDTRVAGVTVSSVIPRVPPTLAVISAVPLATVEANPEAFMVTTDKSSEDHVAVFVTSFVVLSLKVPIAVNCCDVPSAIERSAGVTAIETRAAGVTVNVVEPETPADVAEIELVPAATVVANPCDPAALLIVAIPVLLELHWTEVVIVCVVPSV
jgi:hypothetical protein